MTAKLKDYLATSTQKIFQIEYQNGSSTSLSVYFGNVEKHDDVFNKEMPINRGCLQTTNNELVHPLYESSTILFHGLGARRHRYPYAKKDDYQHIYHGMTTTNGTVPQHTKNGLQSIAKAGDAIYGLDKPSTIGHYYVNDTMYEWLAQDNGYAFPKALPYKTYLYKDDVKETIDLTVLSTMVDGVVEGIKYNTLFEVPGGLYQDYSTGSIFATTVKTKNQYDSKYDMVGDRAHLSKVREYLGIFSNNNQVYLKYRDKTETNSTNGAYKFSLTKTQSGISHFSATEQTSNVSSQEQIEVLENLNRGVEPAKHKSTLYKLKLNAPFVDQLTIKTPHTLADIANLKENVKQEIRNVIRSLAERVAPANAQLFNVEINNDLTEYQDLTYVKVVLDATEGQGGFVKYYYPGDVITLPIPVRSGYKFLGWYKPGSDSTTKQYYSILSVENSDISLSADWEEKTIKYQFTDKYGNVVSTKRGKYGAKFSINENEFQLSGYTFIGFSPDSYKSGTFGPEDQIFTSTYEPNTYEAAYDNLFKFIEWNENHQTELTTTNSYGNKYAYSANNKTGIYQVGISAENTTQFEIDTKSFIADSHFIDYTMVLSTGIDYEIDYDTNVGRNQLTAQINYRESGASTSTKRVKTVENHQVNLPNIGTGGQKEVFGELQFKFSYKLGSALSCRAIRISNIRVFPKNKLTGITYPDLRKVYRYSETGTYQALPEPSSTTKTFAGWYPEDEDTVKNKLFIEYSAKPEYSAAAIPDATRRKVAIENAVRSKFYEYKNSQRITTTSQLPPKCHTLYSYWT